VALSFDKRGGQDRGLSRWSRRGSDLKDDSWSDGKKSNRSDIDLTQRKAKHSLTMNVDVSQGEIHAEREFCVAQATA
jgi:hypothetical protein